MPPPLGGEEEIHPPPASSVSAKSAQGCGRRVTALHRAAVSSVRPPGAQRSGRSIRRVKVEAIEYGDRRVYSVASFNRGVGDWLARLPTVWVEGEVTELRRQDRWQSVFLTLKDPEEGACLAVTMPRGQFDALRLDLANGERVHVYGRPELFETRGDFRLRALSIERFGLGGHLAALERLKQKLAEEGLFDASRKRPLPRLPQRIGLVTGNDAAAKKDVIAAITARFPPARLLVAETYVQGPRAAPAIAEALRAISEAPEIDVVVLARGGGSFEDLLPFSDERLLRAIAACQVPVVSAVGHEQDTPLSDLVADSRASTPTAAARLVVPDLADLTARLERSRTALSTGTRRALERERRRLDLSRDHLRRAPLLLLERRRAALEHSAGRLRALSPRATLDRGYAIVRAGGAIVRESSEVATGTKVDVELGTGGFGATVEGTR
jgi:exodeoxyribonuclease VII large subunit